MDTDTDPIDPRLQQSIAQLRDREPAVDLWPAIAPRLTPRRRGIVVLRWPVALAAGLAIAVLSAGAVTMFLRHTALPATGTVGNAGTIAVEAVAFTAADSTLERAIRDLEATVRASMSRLDPSTRAGIEQSINSLDHAVSDAAVARRAAPGSPRAERYFTAKLRQKLDALENVARLTARRG